MTTAGDPLEPPTEELVIMAAKARRDDAPRMWAIFDGWVAATDSERRWLHAVIAKESLDRIRRGV